MTAYRVKLVKLADNVRICCIRIMSIDKCSSSNGLYKSANDPLDQLLWYINHTQFGETAIVAAFAILNGEL